MQFGLVSIEDAEGAVLAHSFSLSSGRIPKGRILQAQDIDQFRCDDIKTITVARLELHDVDEDRAAQCLANAVKGAGMRIEIAVGGRINLISEVYGALVFDRAWLEAVNAVDETLTLATLEPYSAVEPGQMVGTIKVIPFSVPQNLLSKAEACAKTASFSVIANQPYKVGLVQTILPGTPEKVLVKTSQLTQRRVEGLGSALMIEARCDHTVENVAATIQHQMAAGAELVLIVGASAVCDRRDVIPAAIESLGGAIDHFGMPVDPGNLMLLGHVGKIKVLGVPGCARSPKKNGFDWILQRLVCGLGLSSKDIAGMGAGGLLKEITGRPTPRAMSHAMTASGEKKAAFKVYTLVLAAGNLAPHTEAVVQQAGASMTHGTYVVTGAQEELVVEALAAYTVSYAYNPAFEAGISTSLRRGLSALPSDADAVVVCLDNDPAPSSKIIDALISAFDPKAGITLCTHAGGDDTHANPLLIGRQFFAELHELEGDKGARYLVSAYPAEVVEVTVADLNSGEGR